MTFLTPSKTDRLKTFFNSATDFALANRGRCFEDWERSKVFRYLAFCGFTDRLWTIVKDPVTNEIETLVVMWRENREHLEAMAENNQPVFKWEHAPKRGDCLFVAEVIGNRKSIGTMYRKLVEIQPALLATPIMTFRRGKLVRIPQRVIERFSA